MKKKHIWKNWINIFLGIWIFLLPFSGFPRSWRDLFSALSGLMVAVLSIFLSKAYSEKMLDDKDSGRS